MASTCCHFNDPVFLSTLHFLAIPDGVSSFSLAAISFGYPHSGFLPNSLPYHQTSSGCSTNIPIFSLTFCLANVIFFPCLKYSPYQTIFMYISGLHLSLVFQSFLFHILLFVSLLGCLTRGKVSLCDIKFLALPQNIFLNKPSFLSKR